MPGYGKRFHVKRRGHPRYGYIAKSLLAASSSDGVSRRTILDIGSSIGSLLSALSIESGIPRGSMYGVDYGDVLPEVYEHDRSTYVPHDLTAGPAIVMPQGFDIVVCQEVAEHIPAEFSDNILVSVSINISPDGILLWSAARPGQKGKGHVNLMPIDHWKGMMSRIGLYLDSTKTDIYKAKMDSIVPDWRRNEMDIYREAIIFSHKRDV
jgi:2-polyprenyl-3-methyl-5-hydroxy-6-metoxy-1,4-benzoquinol methylase